MSQIVICSQCSRALPPDAPDALCPYCLLAIADEPTTVATTPGFAAPSIEDLQSHFAIDQLRIVKLIGSGGMGAVYQAQQPRLGRDVALKILPPEMAATAGFNDRFAREARVLAQLDHPNVVDVHDYGTAGPYSYLVLEFIDGVNLRELIRGGEMSPSDAMEVIPQLCDALQYAHDRGIVHRDIKPENILIDGSGRVKITDFGLAKLARTEEVDRRLTGTHQVMGTPSYMAPEQIERPKDVDHRADIYALGVVFYELLTGELPLGRFLPPSEKGNGSRRLDRVVMRTLEKQPERRYAQASDVKSDVEKATGEKKPFREAAAEFVSESAESASASVAAIKRNSSLRTISLVATVAAVYLTLALSIAFPLLLLVTLGLCLLVEWLMQQSEAPAWIDLIAAPPMFVSRQLRAATNIVRGKLVGSSPVHENIRHLTRRDSIGMVMAIVFLVAAFGFLIAIPAEDDFTPMALLMLLASFIAARYHVHGRSRGDLRRVERWLVYPPIIITLLAIAIPLLVLPGFVTAGFMIFESDEIRRWLPGDGIASEVSVFAWSAALVCMVQFAWLALLALLARWSRRPLLWVAHPMLENWNGQWTILGFLMCFAIATISGTAAWWIAA